MSGQKKSTEGKLRFYIHPLYVLLGVALAAIGQLYVFVVYTVVLVLHELGHSVVAENRGYYLDELCLMPYGAVLKGNLEGVRQRDELYIAVAGPLTNIFFSLLCVALWWIVPSVYFYTEQFAIAGFVNAAFNLLPVYPLDGGTALFALLKGKYGLRKASRVVRIVGIITSSVMLVGFVLLAVLSLNLTYGIIGGFVFLSALIRGKSGEYLKLAGTINKKALSRGIEVREYAVGNDSRIVDVLKLVNNQHLIRVVVISEDGRALYSLDERTLADISLRFPPSTLVVDALKNQHGE